jgi:hypothetical protein
VCLIGNYKIHQKNHENPSGQDSITFMEEWFLLYVMVRVFSYFLTSDIVGSLTQFFHERGHCSCLF